MAAYHYKQGDRPLDGYTIQYALGRGGFGEVYFAISDSGREVALKAVQNFEEVELRGISHCMNLKSQHLVMIFDVRRAADGVPWVIMEYVSGPSLRDILDESPQGLDIEQAQFFLRELAKGLSYLHEAGVVHRDLKPHNVFFEDGIIKIGDYSLSKVITASHRSGNTMTVGSVHYMAPEISLGRYDKTVDIYALGVMLHEMLTGQPPYVGESMGEVLMKHLSSTPDVTQIAEPYASAIVKAMQRDPADRYQTAQEMMEAVVGEVAPIQSADHFDPQTLSMIGERSRQAKIDRGVHSYTADSTAQTAIQNTQATASPAPDPVEVPRDDNYAQRLALHYSPPKRVHAIPDTIGVAGRLSLAVIAAAGLLTMGYALADPVPHSLDVFFPVGLAVILLGVMAALFPRTNLSVRGAPQAAFARTLWTLPGFCCFLLTVTRHRDYRIDQYIPLFLALLTCTLVFDWRCLIAPHRHPRVAILPTIVIGVFAMLSQQLLDGHPSFAPLTAALAMAGAVTVQLIAPLRRVAEGAPLVKDLPSAPRQKSKKPPLRYDKTAVFLELLIGAAIAIILALFVNGDDDEELVMLGIFVGFIGLSALRFRLQRRHWPQETQQNKHIPRHPELRQPEQVVTVDKISIVLEILVMAAAFVIGAVIINGDDDFFPIAAIAGLVGFFAMRYRVQRRRHIQQRRHNTEFKLSFDGVSIFLELLIGICTLASVGTLFSGDDDFFGLAAALAVAAFVMLRFRLARRVALEQRRADLSNRSPEHNVTEPHQEVAEMRR